MVRVENVTVNAAAGDWVHVVHNCRLPEIDRQIGSGSVWKCPCGQRWLFIRPTSLSAAFISPWTKVRDEDENVAPDTEPEATEEKAP